MDTVEATDIVLAAPPVDGLRVDAKFPVRTLFLCYKTKGIRVPVIRISDGTMARLKAWAEPLDDTADSALSKVFDVAEKARKLSRSDHSIAAASEPPLVRPRGGSPVKLPQREFRQPLLEVLYEMGGSVHVTDLRPAMKKKMMSVLLPGDLERLSSGEERWWNATCWERFNLVKEGYMRDDSPRGNWALSERGMALVERSSTGSMGPFIEHLLAMPDVGDDSDFSRERTGPRRIEM